MTIIKILASIATTIGAVTALAGALTKGPSPMETALAIAVVLVTLVFAVWAIARIAA